MITINKVILQGFVGSINTTDNAVFISMATNEWNAKTETESTDWHKLVFIYPSLLDRAKKVAKGDEILAYGKIKYGKRIKAKNGKYYWEETQILIDSFQSRKHNKSTSSEVELEDDDEVIDF